MIAVYKLTNDDIINMIIEHGESAVIYAFNSYITDYCNDSDCIYSMTDFDDVTADIGRHELATMICYDGFNPYDNYFAVNGGINFISFNVGGLAMHIVNHIEHYYDDVVFFLDAIDDYNNGITIIEW